MNDFQEVLKDFINTLNLPLHARLDYFQTDDDLVIYSLPGGKIDKEFMDGTREMSLNFEIAVKTQDQRKANDTMWAINQALSDLRLSLPSQNKSYNFMSLDVEKPFLNDKNEKGFYVYLLDVTAHIEI
ncbi:minor capsid protein [Pseudolactococcus yaeyamensis]